MNLTDIWYLSISLLPFANGSSETEVKKIFESINNWRFNNFIVLGPVFPLLTSFYFHPYLFNWGSHKYFSSFQLTQHFFMNLVFEFLVCMDIRVDTYIIQSIMWWKVVRSQFQIFMVNISLHEMYTTWLENHYNFSCLSGINHQFLT